MENVEIIKKGYCRVSSVNQHEDRQVIELISYGVPERNIYIDKQSGKDFDRKDYLEMKSILERGDEVVVHSLDRLGRDKEGIKNELAWFKAHGVIVRILDVPTTLIAYPAGQEWVMDMVNNILIEVLGAFAQQERENIRKRQREGIDAMPVVNGRKVSAKTGRSIGRTEKRPDNFEDVYRRQQSGELTLKEAMAAVGVGRTRWYELAREVA